MATGRLTEGQIKLEKLKSRLARIEKQLDKNRTSTMQDGWQTQKFARKSRNWDFYARQKMIIRDMIDCCESNDRQDMCPTCGCWKNQ
jgi:hypothetical protein